MDDASKEVDKVKMKVGFCVRKFLMIILIIADQPKLITLYELEFRLTNFKFLYNYFESNLA